MRRGVEFLELDLNEYRKRPGGYRPVHELSNKELVDYLVDIDSKFKASEKAMMRGIISQGQLKEVYDEATYLADEIEFEANNRAPSGSEFLLADKDRFVPNYNWFDDAWDVSAMHGRPRMANPPLKKELKRLRRMAERAGWNVDRTKKNHLRWRSPTGEMVITSSTPSDSRAIHSIKRDLRRAGMASELLATNPTRRERFEPLSDEEITYSSRYVSRMPSIVVDNGEPTMSQRPYLARDELRDDALEVILSSVNDACEAMMHYVELTQPVAVSPQNIILMDEPYDGPIGVGDFVSVAALVNNEYGVFSEKFWAEIVGQDEDTGMYVGRVDNDLRHSDRHGIKLNDTIAISPEMVRETIDDKMSRFDREYDSGDLTYNELVSYIDMMKNRERQNPRPKRQMKRRRR